MGDKWQGEIVKMLHNYNIHTRSHPPLKHLEGWGVADPASPDIVGGNAKTILIEIKTGDLNSFPFSKWKEHQREWARNIRIQSGIEYWLAIVIPMNEIVQAVKRVAFLIPYPVMLKLEELIRPFQNSVPFRLNKAHLLLMRDQGLDMEQLLDMFRLDWVPRTGWVIPKTHSFYWMYLRHNTSYLYKHPEERDAIFDKMMLQEDSNGN